MTDLIYLLLLIAAPTLIPILLVTAMFGSGKKLYGRCKSALTLHADKGLSQQGLLWLSIISPFSYFILLGCVAWQEYTPSLTGIGLDIFVKISSVPLTVLSISLPLSVLVSSFHSTRQTAEQITITRYKI